MKRIFILTICCLLAVFAFAQFGGGSGTESDPYRIYNINQWTEFAEEYNNPQSVYGDFSGIHLRLMENINDTINIRMVGYIPSTNSYKEFNGHFHGGGHTLILSMPQYGESFQWYWLKNVGEVGTIDSIDFRGKISSKCMSVIVETNYGHISYCTMDFDCSGYLPEDSYSGMCQYNLGVIEYVSNYTQIPMGIAFIGICDENHEGAIISHCINYAEMNPKEETAIVAGISHINYGGTIEYCMNVGDINNVRWEAAGILVQNFSVQHEVYDYESHEMVVDTIMRGVVRNCINLGNMECVEINNVMKGAFVAENAEGLIQNCFNAGNAKGYITDVYFLENDTVHIGVIGYADNSSLNIDYTIENCLNIGNTLGIFINVIINNNDENRLSNNYYDKQMCGGFVNDTVGAIESRLTSQLTGDPPELRAMLGEGWCYAEGRYPIPLGFENDSIALRAATPIFLHAESDDNYEHIDSVASHFTVSTANGASWTTISHNVEISGENATLRHVGGETLKTRLNNLYEKRIHLNIVNVPVVAETIVLQDIDVYPNPVGNTLNITSSETISEIEIVNVMGQVVRRIEVNSDNAVCDVEDLKAGVFVVRIHAASATLSQRKFVKK